MALTQEQIQKARELAQARSGGASTTPTSSAPVSLLTKYSFPTKPEEVPAPTLKDKLAGRVSEFKRHITDPSSLMQTTPLNQNALRAAGDMGGAVLDIGETITEPIMKNVVNPISEKINTGLDKLYGYEEPSSVPAGNAMQMVEEKFNTLSPDTQENLKAVGNIAGGALTLEGARQGLKSISDSVGVLGEKTGATNAIKNIAKDPLENARKSQIDDLEQTYREMAGTTEKTRNAIYKGQQATQLKNKTTIGRAPERVLAEDGIIPNVESGRLVTKAQAEDYVKRVAPLEEANKEAIKVVSKNSPLVNLNEQKRIAIEKARTPENINSGEFASVRKEIEAEYNNLIAELGENVNIETLNGIKSARFRTVYDATRPKLGSANNYIAKTAKETIEDAATKIGADDVAQLNREIGDRLSAAELLSTMDGKVVKGGRLGRYVAATLGSTLGTTIPGKIAGALGGDIVAKILIDNSVASPVKRLILKNLQTKNPAAYDETIQWLRESGFRDEYPALPPGSTNREYVGDYQMRSDNQIPTQTQQKVITNSIIDDTIPQNKGLENELDYQTFLENGGKDEINVPDNLKKQRLEEIDKELFDRGFELEQQSMKIQELDDKYRSVDIPTYKRLKKLGYNFEAGASKTGYGNDVTKNDVMFNKIAKQLEDIGHEQGGAKGEGLRDVVDELDKYIDEKENIKVDKSVFKDVSKQLKEEKRLISEEAYQNAKKNFKENMGRINSGIPVDQIKDLTIMAAYHIENGVKSATELAKVLAKEGYELTKDQVNKLYLNYKFGKMSDDDYLTFKKFLDDPTDKNKITAQILASNMGMSTKEILNGKNFRETVYNGMKEKEANMDQSLLMRKSKIK